MPFRRKQKKLKKSCQQKYPGETASNASTITLLVQRFRGTGSVVDRKRSGRASIVKMKVADVEKKSNEKQEQRSPMKRPSFYITINTEFISLMDSDERCAWLQQDGATCHTSRDCMEVLNFSMILSFPKDFPWPPRPLDLPIHDFSFEDI
ncbi:DUF4817 domain-containing protein [Trichonephila clavipes]|nr:DUF4817 domain-containing protein [Trichonephila clavipes]